MIPIYKPYLPSSCLTYAREALDSTWISSNGQYLDSAKNMLEKIFEGQYILLTNNGTAATHLIAKTLSLTECKRIAVPNNVYVAVWNTLLYDKELEIVPIDADLDTWNFDTDELIARRDEYDAVMVVHNLGNVVNVLYLQEVLKDKIFVEDNCEGLFGKYDGHFTGTKSLCSSASFYGNKTITSGEGGMYMTGSSYGVEFMRKIHGQGQSRVKFSHDILGYNYRMTNIQAAILHGQLKKLDLILKSKREIFFNYGYLLDELNGVSGFKVENGTRPANWMFALRFESGDYRIAEPFFKSKGIETRPMFYPITEHFHLVDNPRVKDCKTENAHILHREVVVFPSYPELTFPELIHITDSIKEYARQCKNIRS